MIARFFAYQFGSHQIDWEILGGVLAVVVVLWVWSACRLAARSTPKPADRRDDVPREWKNWP